MRIGETLGRVHFATMAGRVDLAGLGAEIGGQRYFLPAQPAKPQGERVSFKRLFIFVQPPTATKTGDKMAILRQSGTASEVKKQRKEIEDAANRLDLIYLAAEDSGDHAAAIKATVEKSKLLRLYTPIEIEETDGDGETEQERLARAHLEGLGIFPQGQKLDELARLAALWITNNTNGKTEWPDELAITTNG